MAFYSGALRTSREVIQLVCQSLDEETVEAVASALEDGYRLVMLSDPTGIVIALLDPATGHVGSVLASVNADTRREVIYRLRRPMHREPSRNGTSLPCRSPA